MYTCRMTKFLLVIYLCSQINQQCYQVNQKPYEYKDYWSCMRDGYGKSFELLYSDTKKENVEKYRFSTRWTCAEFKPSNV
jgi:hypothetical protein